MKDSETVITARGLGKAFRLYPRADDRLKQFVLGRGIKRETFWALQEVDLVLRRGEAVGVIGENGAGKSTFLRLLSGTLRPTTGSVTVTGRMAALLELGAGFNPRFTGRENVWLSAAVLGLTKDQIAERFPAIAAFAGIGEFIDLPVRLYSSGMQARLAFAVSAHVDADILIVDEILSVGDAAFAQKCQQYLDRFRARGTLLFVSHNSGLVAKLCERALWLEKGRVRELGPAREVCANYLATLAERSASERGPDRRIRAPELVRAPPIVKDPRKRTRNRMAVSAFNPQAPWHGHGGATIADVFFSDLHNSRVAEVEGGEELTLHIVCDAQKRIVQPIVGFLLRDRLGQNVFGDSTYYACRHRENVVQDGESFEACFTFQLPYLTRGEYGLTVAITEGTQEDHTHIHWIEEAVVLTVCDGPVRLGIVGIPSTGIELFIAGDQLQRDCPSTAPS